MLKKMSFAKLLLFKIFNTSFLNFLKEKEFFKKSTQIEKAKFLGFVSLENSDKISELPISKPKFIFLLNIFFRLAKSLSVILKPWPTKGCKTCKESPNKRVLS